MKEYSNSELYNGIIGQNQEALNYLYTHFFTKIVRLIQNHGGKESDAKDIFQESIVIFYKKNSTGAVDSTTPILPYLMNTCKLIWLATYRKKSKLTSSIPSDIQEENELYNEYLLGKRRALYNKHFSNLDESCKALLMAYFDGASFREIAEKFSIKEDYARRKKQICKEYLVRKIKEDPEFNLLVGDDGDGLFE